MRRLSRLVVVSLATVAYLMPLAQQAQEPQEEKPGFKRRDDSSDEDLRKQLQLVPEAGFDQPTAAVLHASLSKLTENRGGKLGQPGAIVQPDVGQRFYAQMAQQFKRPDWLALPWRIGQDSQLGKETAEKLHVFSGNLRACMRTSVPRKEVSPDPAELKKQLSKGEKGVGKRAIEGNHLEWNKPEAVPTLAQMLQTENTGNRLLMIELLAGIDAKEAGATLAQRALFDLSPEVREKAVEALAKRPAKEYQQILLDGLRWPWSPAADHAAEAMSALQMNNAVPELVALLKEPDPKLSFTKDKATFVREMVRINHLSNCLLCHAPSLSRDDLVRGLVPTPGQELAPLYYAAQTGLFVRADITFLRQDFSLVQPVTNPGKWPGFQRYDYMLRTRKATNQEVKLLQGLQKDNKLSDPYAQRDAVLFALRGITKTDKGSTYESWQPLLNPIEKKAEPNESK